MQKADRDALAGKRLADEVCIFAGHDLQQRALAGAVQPEHADLGAEVEREPDVVQHSGVGRVHLPEALHRVDKLRHRNSYILHGTQSALSSRRPRRFATMRSLRSKLISCAGFSTSTWTRSTRRSSSATTRRCAASRWRSAARPTERGVVAAASYEARRVRRALGHADGAGRPPVSGAGDRPARLRAVPGRLSSGVRRSSARSRRWSSRCRSTRPISTSPRTRGASRSGRRGQAAEGTRSSGRDRADRVGRRRAEQVPREDRVRLAEAGRPHRDRPGTGRAVPAAAAGGCVCGASGR